MTIIFATIKLTFINFTIGALNNSIKSISDNSENNNNNNYIDNTNSGQILLTLTNINFLYNKIIRLIV